MKLAKWIWLHDSDSEDEYVQFIDTFRCDGEKTYIKIASDTNYILYVNGEVAAFGQYAAYPEVRVYDTVDISRYVVSGDNRLAVVVWYWGLPAMQYVVGKAGLAYEVICDEQIVAYSSKHTLCRYADDYEQGKKKYINSQQGLTYYYSPMNADGFYKKDYQPQGFSEAVERIKDFTFVPRPNQKLKVERTRIAKLIDSERGIYDLGEECAGVLHIKYHARKNTRFRICFGEYIADDGNLFRLYDDHDYTLNYVGSGKWEEHVAYMRRIGCRYLQVLGNDVEIELLGLKETLYPLTAKDVVAKDPLIKDIYDVSVRTLVLCMHEHYEDCPWREQVLYNMDSRNAMLYTYEIFGDTEFARSNLWLMSLVKDKDGFYPASFPSGEGKWSIIPIFNLVYVIQCQEYLDYSGDSETLKALYPRLNAIIDNFKSRLVNGLLKETEGCWNFVEWTENMTGQEGTAGNRTSLALNCFFILALKSFARINEALGKQEENTQLISQLCKNVYDGFFDEETCAFSSYIEEEHVCALGNALAVLSGCAFDQKDAILERLSQGGWQDASLAMKGFVYDALLESGDRYHDVILNDILKDYTYMLQRGATSFWESIEGEKMYNGAGSLCHVWSSMPIIYFRKLGVVRPKE